MFLKITPIGRNQAKTLPKLFRLCAPKFLLIIMVGEIVYKVCVLMIKIIVTMIIEEFRERRLNALIVLNVPINATSSVRLQSSNFQFFLLIVNVNVNTERRNFLLL